MPGGVQSSKPELKPTESKGVWAVLEAGELLENSCLLQPFDIYHQSNGQQQQ